MPSKLSPATQVWPTAPPYRCNHMAMLNSALEKATLCQYSSAEAAMGVFSEGVPPLGEGNLLPVFMKIEAVGKPAGEI
jgi:hypothetical protein